MKKNKLLKEIQSVLTPKLYNIDKGTATEMELFIVKECLGFISLVKYSSLSEKDIKKLWDKSGFQYR